MAKHDGGVDSAQVARVERDISLAYLINYGVVCFLLWMWTLTTRALKNDYSDCVLYKEMQPSPPPPAVETPEAGSASSLVGGAAYADENDVTVVYDYNVHEVPLQNLRRVLSSESAVLFSAAIVVSVLLGVTAIKTIWHKQKWLDNTFASGTVKVAIFVAANLLVFVHVVSAFVLDLYHGNGKGVLRDACKLSSRNTDSGYLQYFAVVGSLVAIVLVTMLQYATHMRRHANVGVFTYHLMP